MPHAQVPLTELGPGHPVAGTYRLKQCLQRQTPQGRTFILGEIADAAGSVGIVWWNSPADAHQRLRSATHVTVDGKSERYRERLQVVCTALAPATPSPEEAGALEPVARCDIEQEWQALLGMIEGIGDTHLRALLRAILVDDDHTAVRFRRAPAAVSMHHPWPGGLLAHTVQMVRAAEAMLALYPRLDRDLLIAATLLHDLCKIDEIGTEGSYAYTTEGQLIGHVVLGAQRVVEAAAAIDGFPPRLRDKLQHCILAHHGRPEWGAAREPVLPEALVLHHIDNIDARLEALFRAVDETTSGDPEWTEFNRMLGVRVYRGP